MSSEKQSPSHKPKNIVIPLKKPKLSKAERRALQEEQRREKAELSGTSEPKQQKKRSGPVSVSSNSEKSKSGGGRKEEEKKEDGLFPSLKKDDKIVELFSHLDQYCDRSTDPHLSGVTLERRHPPCSKKNSSKLHPLVLSLGTKYADGSVRGANERCRSMMVAFLGILRDHVPPASTTDFRQYLDHDILKPSFQHWTTKCRHHSVTMGNAMTFLKTAIHNLDRDLSWEETREETCEIIDAYVQERITFSKEVIAKHACSKMKEEGEVLLVYGRSEVLESVLTLAREEKKKFRVIVVDARPHLEGRAFLDTLMEGGFEDCVTYTLLNSLSYVMMREVTKVFLGAECLMGDGSVLGRVGTASVALTAQSYNIPVLFCCESYKICNRVQLESITTNELGDPNDFLRNNRGSGKGEDVLSTLTDWKEIDNLKLLNLKYDLTPSEFVSGIITEMGILPATSVMVLLREMSQQGSV